MNRFFKFKREILKKKMQSKKTPFVHLVSMKGWTTEELRLHQDAHSKKTPEPTDEIEDYISSLKEDDFHLRYEFFGQLIQDAFNIILQPGQKTMAQREQQTHLTENVVKWIKIYNAMDAKKR